uniref:Uncharacterized protein n=1 Tax=Cacopsylla melanoneura TaxID=428564 RepID=A0A8D8VUF0_9HEMI
MVIFPQSIGLLRNAWGSFSAPNSPNPVALNGRRNSFQVTICHYFFCTVYKIATMFHYFYFPYSFYNKIRVRFSFHIKSAIETIPTGSGYNKGKQHTYSYTRRNTCMFFSFLVN